MRRPLNVSMSIAAAIAALVLPLAPATLAPSSAAGPSAVRAAAPTAAAPVADGRQGLGKGKGGKAPLHYTPRTGILFNNSMGGIEARRRIIGHLIRTIESVPGGQKIRIASWNVRSDAITEALVQAHRRGVSVRVVMDRVNANKFNPNRNVSRLADVFHERNSKRAADMKSRLTKCVSSCRYPAGIAHTKFFLFSKAGKARDVIIYGSANATDLAAFAQWNDVYTLTGKPEMYAAFETVFNEMMRDAPVQDPYRTFEQGKYTAYFYPYKGPGSRNVIPDPILDVLNKVQCSGATDGSGINGRTKVRIAQTSMYAERGLAIARKIRDLWQQGCNVKMVYAVFGNNVLKVLRNTSRGPVPFHQIASDNNRDGIYDRYLHMKNMAISGVYDGQTNVDVTFNGSANYTSVALASDEIVMRIYGRRIARTYSNWVDYLYNHQPPGAGQGHGGAGAVERRAITNGVNPYEKILAEDGVGPEVLQ